MLRASSYGQVSKGNQQDASGNMNNIFSAGKMAQVVKCLLSNKQGPGDAPQNPRLHMHTQELEPVYILLILVLERQSSGAHWPAHQD